MKSRITLLLLSLIVVVSVLAGCTTKQETPETDVVTGPTRIYDEAAFEKAISPDGTFIAIVEKDLTFTKDLTVDGKFTKEGSDDPVRALAFVTYVEGGREVDTRFTVTVPNIVINSENTLHEYGIIKGDVYVQAAGFRTADATIDGNLYFATQELMDAFAIDEKSEVTGNIEVREYTK